MLNSEFVEESLLYKKMYLHLFNRVTDVLEKSTVDEIKDILIKAQCETEEIYIERKLDEENQKEMENILNK